MLKPLFNLVIAVALVFSVFFAESAGALKVFFLAGQSNMQGHGRLESGNGSVNGAIGSLRYQVNNDPAKYGHLVDTNGDWVTRDDVWVWNRNGTDTGKTTGNLGVQYGVDGDRFGPELGFGNVVGDYFDEQVVLIKTAWGGKSLAVDFRPPSAVAARGGSVGPYYTIMINSIQEALGDVAAQFPGQELELSGFGWHQGWNDRINGTFVDEYEANFTDFINDVRAELGEPGLPFVIANTGIGGYDIPDNASYKARVEKHMEEQLDVADPAEHPEFAGTVGGVETRPFWREADVSPRNQGFHWNQNGETYYLIGEAMGQGMVGLVPEPGSFALLSGFGMLALARRRRA